MPEAIISLHPGLFSTSGLLATDLRIDESATVLAIMDAPSIGGIAAWFDSTAVSLRMSPFGALPVGTAPSSVEVSQTPEPVSTRIMKLREMPQPAEVPVYTRYELGARARLLGPCIVEQPDATTVVLTGQVARVDGFGNLWIREAINE